MGHLCVTVATGYLEASSITATGTIISCTKDRGLHYIVRLFAIYFCISSFVRQSGTTVSFRPTGLCWGSEFALPSRLVDEKNMLALGHCRPFFSPAFESKVISFPQGYPTGTQLQLVSKSAPQQTSIHLLMEPIKDSTTMHLSSSLWPSIATAGPELNGDQVLPSLFASSHCLTNVIQKKSSFSCWWGFQKRWWVADVCTTKHLLSVGENSWT